MTAQSVLIAAYSGRALAQAARRAGYIPLVVDSFGDSDTREAAHAYTQIAGAVRVGFSAKPLFAALDALMAKAPSPPLGIVLGSGFEDRPKLIAALDTRYRLLGTKAETVAELKNPATFFSLLKQLAIAHPPTSLTPPGESTGWIAKRAGAAGGAHIRDLSALKRSHPKHYFQRRLEGTPMSVLAVCSKGGVALELSRQWTAPSPAKPYRYGGAVVVDYAETAWAQQMVSAAATLVELLDPVGLVSFDFIVSEDMAHLLEVNPRPGATLDVFDDAKGNLFRAHVEAALGNALWRARELPNVQALASAVLYADRGAATAGAIDWPDWARDRPLPGTHLVSGQPIASVIAEGASAQEAEDLARARLSKLADLVYRQSQKGT